MGEETPEKETREENEASGPAYVTEEREDNSGEDGMEDLFPNADPDKADLLNRAIARFIDVLIALLLARFPGYVGFLLGIAYLGIADGLPGGASLGKRVIGLCVKKDPAGSPADYRDSIIRNSTVCLLYAALWIPLLGWAVAVAGAGFEFLLMLGSPQGKRLGDEVASTVVRRAEKTAEKEDEEETCAGPVP